MQRGVPPARRRAADLRHRRCTSASPTATSPSQIAQRVEPRPAGAAGAVGQLAVLARHRHRLRQHPHDHLAALAHARARPARSTSAAEYDKLVARPDRLRGDRRRQDGLLRRPAVLARADRRAAGLRRLPARRRRRADRRAVPRDGRGGRGADRARRAAPSAPAPAAPGRDVAGGAQRAGRRAARRSAPARTASRPAEAVRALLRSAAPAARGTRRLATRQRADRGHARAAATRPTASARRSPSRAASPTSSRPSSPRPTARRAAGARPLTSLRRYPARAGDEAFMAVGRYRARSTGRCSRSSRTSAWSSLAERQRAPRQVGGRAGITFGVDGAQRPSRSTSCRASIPAHEWAALSSRARRSGRGRSRCSCTTSTARPGSSPTACCRPDVVHDAPGLAADEARLLPPGRVRAPIMGFDLVRNELGGWRVLEDNVRVPSGVGYAIGVCGGCCDDVHARAAATDGLLDPRRRSSLRPHRCAPCSARPNATVALLSDGAGNSAWFEHRLLAEGAGLLLVQPDDVDVTGRPGVTAVGQRDRRALPAPGRRAGRPARRRPGGRSARGSCAAAARAATSCWPTRPATASPTTRRCTAACPT